MNSNNDVGGCLKLQRTSLGFRDSARCLFPFRTAEKDGLQHGKLYETAAGGHDGFTMPFESMSSRKRLPTRSDTIMPAFEKNLKRLA